MLGAMVGGHSQCVCVPESHFIEHLLTLRGFEPGAVEPRNTLANIVAHERYRLLWDLPLDPASINPHEVGSTYAEVLSWLVRAYGRRLGKSTALLWVDHTPSNFKRGLAMLRLFPDARFIHIVRDGRGVAASVLPLDWGPNDIVSAATFWMARCGLGLAAELHLGAARVLRVRYEDLLLSPEPTLRKVAEFAGLEYEPAMARGTGHSPMRYNERQHRLVGQPPDRSRASSWTDTLTRREIEIFEAETGSLLESLGYQLEYGVRARPATPAELIQMRAQAPILRLRNYLRRRRRVRSSLPRSRPDRA